MAIIASVVARIKSAPLKWLGGADRVDQCFASAAHCWRNSLLTPARTLGLFMVQILHGNTSIRPAACCRGLTVFRGATAMRGPGCLWRRLQRWLRICLAMPLKAASRMHAGWVAIVVMTDATTAVSPDQPELRNVWPQLSAQKPGCGFPAIKLLMDFATGMILHLTATFLKVHEMSQLAGPHAMLRAGDVLPGDRAFCSFAHLWMLGKMMVHGVFRMHQR